jgi:hypothetical protein
MENVGMLYDHLEYFTAIWYNLRQFGIIWFISPRFGKFGPRKIWQPLSRCTFFQVRSQESADDLANYCTTNFGKVKALHFHANKNCEAFTVSCRMTFWPICVRIYNFLFFLS